MTNPQKQKEIDSLIRIVLKWRYKLKSYRVVDNRDIAGLVVNILKAGYRRQTKEGDKGHE